MSWRASAYIKALVVCPNGERISRTEKLVALVLADSHQDKANAHTYPAVKMIAEDSLMDPRVCRRVLAALERKGVIERERAEHQGRGQLTFYRFPALDGKGGQDVLLPDADFLGKRRTEGGRKGDKKRTPSIEEQEQESKQIPPPQPPQAGECGRKEQQSDAGTTKSSAASVAAKCIPIRENKPASASHVDLDYANVRPAELDREAVPERKSRASNSGTPGDSGDVLGRAIDAAVELVMTGCGFTSARLRRKLRPVVAQRVKLGKDPGEVAAAMIDAWQRYGKQGTKLFRRVSAAEFYEGGLWLNSNLWNWDNQAIREAQMEMQASVGSWR